MSEVTAMLIPDLKTNRPVDLCPGKCWLGAMIVLMIFSGCYSGAKTATEIAYPHKPENYKDAVERLKQVHQLLIAEEGVPGPRLFQADCDHPEGSGMSHCSEFLEVFDREFLVEGRTTLEIPIAREWSDLVRWLPYIAADSNLARPSWDRINGHSGQLLRIAEQIYDADERIFQRNYRAQARQLEQIYGELSGMLDAYEKMNQKHPF